ncbi:Fungal lipase-type domain-containing protein [Caenorhabditis elegans]|uniref:Fungal lipase-type domain-containing protein n=2 Tax=Caenorhabditis elegans TaxID=6239 RepID=A0A1I6CM73_CAEEL|nr:Fungal lipase-like domain-containing protein [Caenorhabditis elegans]SFQ94280.1 Fungal lipase-like domain-containing protein [Caenorhabditis elegans]|eukprot:NP_499052.3 Uncharacterized protein CELE_C40H1.7 [Caenorhabditis elegans]
MTASPAAYLLLHLFLRLTAKTCWQCLQDGGQFCLDNNQCIVDVLTIETKCNRIVDLPINCPSVPALQYAYDDDFVRNTVLPVIAATGTDNPQKCLDNQLPSMKVYKRREANCSSLFSDVTCSGYTGIDFDRKVIVLSVRGSHGDHQYYDLWKIGNFNGTVPFLNIGRVTKKFNDNFESLWYSGLGEDLQNLIDAYPDYQLWITGYSMGASIALLTSAFIAQTGMSSPYNMKVILFGCPRCTDYDFAMWHSTNFPYSYHIIHAHDYAPRLPFFDNIDNTTLYHPRSEVWYNNDMREGDSFVICEQADQPFCSSQVQNLSNADHAHYFNMDLYRWSADGCPKNKEDYRPIAESAVKNGKTFSYDLLIVILGAVIIFL